MIIKQRKRPSTVWRDAFFERIYKTMRAFAFDVQSKSFIAGLSMSFPSE